MAELCDSALYVSARKGPEYGKDGGVYNFNIEKALATVRTAKPTDKERAALAVMNLACHAGAVRIIDLQLLGKVMREHGLDYTNLAALFTNLLAKRRVLLHGGWWVATGLTEAALAKLIERCNGMAGVHMRQALVWANPTTERDESGMRQAGILQYARQIMPPLAVSAADGGTARLPAIYSDLEALASLANRAARDVEQAISYSDLAGYLDTTYRLHFTAEAGHGW